MDQVIHIENHIKNTCDLVIQHIKNVQKFQKNSNKSLGWHSRFIENLFHPETTLIFKGTSKALIKDDTQKKTKEHIVPMTYLLNHLWLLIEQNTLSDNELSCILQRNLGVAYISEKEQKTLDSILKVKMPNEWCLITGDPLDRLKFVGIKLINEDGKEINCLI